MFEVELKFQVASLVPFREAFLERGACSVASLFQTDEYWNDPLRDFAKQDIALRIRQVDDRYWLTFKGPNLDQVAKIRVEEEVSLGGKEMADQMAVIFRGLGFFSVAQVVKRRETMQLDWKGRGVHICLDEVAEVGQFIELELVVDDKMQIDSSKQHLLELARQVGLADPIRTSYLELLLRGRGEA